MLELGFPIRQAEHLLGQVLLVLFLELLYLVFILLEYLLVLCLRLVLLVVYLLVELLLELLYLLSVLVFQLLELLLVLLVLILSVRQEPRLDLRFNLVQAMVVLERQGDVADVLGAKRVGPCFRAELWPHSWSPGRADHPVWLSLQR